MYHPWNVSIFCPGGIYLLKVNNRNTRTRCKICSNLILKTPERRLLLTLNIFYTCFSVSIVNFEHVIAGWVLIILKSELFLDISKPFDKVWHIDHICKLKMAYRVTMKTIIDFLSFRKQRVVLNGQVSQWSSIEAGVPRGFILGPLLFLIYINDLSDDLSTNAKRFANGTSFFFFAVHDINTSAINN